MTKTIFWTGSHTTYKHVFHIVFCPKYRRKVLHHKLVHRLKELLYECARTNKWFIHELEILPDHVHLLLQLPATVTVPKAIQYLKGGSSRVIRQEFPELEEFLWGDSLWLDGYFSETVGRATEAAIRIYIKRQWEQESSGTSHGL